MYFLKINLPDINNVAMSIYDIRQSCILARCYP